MNETKRQARFAGILYALACLPAPFALLYVPRRLMVPEDATATADRVRALVPLVRAAIAVELINSILIVFAVLAFYRLFKAVSQSLARAMAVLILLSVPISLFNILNEIAPLILVSGAKFLAVFDQRQVDSMVYFFLRLHSYGLVVAGIFWGLWLFPFGILAMRSRFIPRLIGLFMFLAGVPYVATALTSLVLPQFAYVSNWFDILTIGELPMIIWLLVWGAKSQVPQTDNAAPAIA